MADRRPAAFAAVPLRALGAGLTAAEHSVLLAVAGFDRMSGAGNGRMGCTAPLALIADMAGVEYSRASGALSALARKGLVERIPDPEDGRRFHWRVVYSGDADAWLNRLQKCKGHPLPDGKGPPTDALPDGKFRTRNSLRTGPRKSLKSYDSAGQEHREGKDMESEPSSLPSSSSNKELPPPQLGRGAQDSIEGKGRLPAVPDDVWTAFWNLHPKAIDERDARVAFAEAMAAGTEPAVIIEGARRVNAEVVAGRMEAKHVPAAPVWLRRGRWTDRFVKKRLSDPGL